MEHLVHLDRLKVTVVVDNETDGLSAPCACCDASLDTSERAATYTSEVSTQVSAVKSGQADHVNFETMICKAGHGLSLLLEAEVGGITRRLLFDGGPCPQLFRMNATSLQLPMASIEALVLSHWHVDHSVGLTAAAQLISEARSTAVAAAAAMTDAGDSSKKGPRDAADEVEQTPPVTVDLHPRRPYRRGLLLPGSPKVIPFNKDPELSDLELPGLQVQQHSEGHTLLGNSFFVSGFIPRVVKYESGNPSHVSQWTANGDFEEDALIEDERYVAAFVKGKGMVVFSACSHAGIINVMTDVAAQSGQSPYAVFGGFHLAPRECASRVAATVSDMAALQPALVVGGHCTGWQAKNLLAAELKGRYMPSFVGSKFSIAASSSTDDLPAAIQVGAAVNMP